MAFNSPKVTSRPSTLATTVSGAGLAPAGGCWAMSDIAKTGRKIRFFMRTVIKTNLTWGRAAGPNVSGRSATIGDCCQWVINDFETRAVVRIGCDCRDPGGAHAVGAAGRADSGALAD